MAKEDGFVAFLHHEHGEEEAVWKAKKDPEYPPIYIYLGKGVTIVREA